jgi:hypothetical protein
MIEIIFFLYRRSMIDREIFTVDIFFFLFKNERKKKKNRKSRILMCARLIDSILNTHGWND